MSLFIELPVAVSIVMASLDGYICSGNVVAFGPFPRRVICSIYQGQYRDKDQNQSAEADDVR